MHPDLIAYAAGVLDEPARGEFERLLQADADLRRQLDVARKRLAPLLANEPPAPPADLVVNTLAFVAEHACKSAPRAETTASQAAFSRPWWRRVDLIVAASVLVAALGLSLPAIAYLRAQNVQAQCASNLKQMWHSLESYRDRDEKRSLPNIASVARPAAGMVVPMLRDAGVLPTSAVPCCPGAGALAASEGAACYNLSVDELAKMSDHEFGHAATNLLSGYAYSLGFRDKGQLFGPTSPDIPAARMPLLADALQSPVPLTGNSPNHAGRGQNVLFTDGHVAFKTLRTAGLPGDDIYLNQNNQVAAGLGTHDVVLGNGGATP